MAGRTITSDEDPLADYRPHGEDSSAPDGESWDDAMAAPGRPGEPGAAHDPDPGAAAEQEAAAIARRNFSRQSSAVERPSGVTPIEVGAETAVLAAILTSPEVFDDLVDKLVPDDFGVPAHAAIYASVLACDASGRPFTTITVADEMLRAGTLSRSGGSAYLEQIVTSDPALENLGAYVDIIVDRSLRRRMVNASRVIGTAALDAGKDARAALDVAEHTVFELGQNRIDAGIQPMPLLVAQLHKEMAQAKQAKLIGHSTGIEKLDELTGGFRGGQFIIIAARPAMGKSVLAMQIARHISEAEDVVVPILTYEMTQSEVGFRLLSSGSGIGLQALTRGIIPAGKERDMAQAAEKLGALRLLIDDHPPQTISGVRSAMRRLARRGPLGAIVVDYLQLMNGDGTRRDENRQQEVSTISRQLKLLAGELDVPVIAVSQLSRGLESRPNRRPLLADLRESGSLEQDANLVAFLFREHVYDKSADERHAELIIAKNRSGPLETIPLDWDGPCVRFLNTDRLLDEPAGRPAGGFGGGPGGAPAGGGFGGGFGGGGRTVVRPDIF